MGAFPIDVHVASAGASGGLQCTVDAPVSLKTGDSVRARHATGLTRRQVDDILAQVPAGRTPRPPAGPPAGATPAGAVRMSLVSAFVPIWVLTVVGYLACRGGLLGAAGAAVLGRFVFHLAMPAALFLALSRMPLSGFAGRPLLAFAVSTATVVGFGWGGASRLFGREPGERPIWGMTAGYVNSANLGIPIAAQVLGDVAFLAQVVLFQVLVVSPVILVALAQRPGGAGPGPSDRLPAGT